MAKYRHLVATYLPALTIVTALSATHRVSSFAIGNCVTQAVLFTAVAAIPAYRTRRMSYVDIAWPWGLVAIGLQVPVYAPRFGPASAAIATVYLAVGLRMAFPGVVYLAQFRRLEGEFARYRYQRLRWAAAGWDDERVPMQLEIFIQALANMSVLAAPALLVTADPNQRLRLFGVIAFIVWLRCWSLEWLADRQKRQFASRAKRSATCQVGLWRYSRHPNYFFQWLGWVALAVAAAPSLIRVAQSGSATQTGVLALALVAAPAFMLWTLVHLTGITPAEHYSVQKRPGYAEYQRTTNRFVPGRRRHGNQPSVAHQVRA